MPEDWSRAEVDATVAAYLGMLERELAGDHYNKSASRRELLARLSGRSEGAIERKHQNISAVLIDLGFSYVEGYKPLPNYQRLLYDVVRDRLQRSPHLVEAVRRRAEEPLVEPPRVADLLSRLVAMPAAAERERRTHVIADRRRVRPLTNYLELEARNRRLGRAGEDFVLRFEHERLWRAGRKQLAERIEHVSRTRGDGEGYDVQSFEENGRERLIEVKTTTFGIHTPFFITRNELDVSTERADEYHVYRLFHFRDDPKLYVAPGAIADSFALEPTEFVARGR